MYAYTPELQFHSYINILEKPSHLSTYPGDMDKIFIAAEFIAAQNVKESNAH